MPAVILPNGIRAEVADSDMDLVTKAGGRALSAEEMADAGARAIDEEAYSSPGQKLLAFGEGLLSGASLGLVDPLLADDATRGRAEFNPITRGVGTVAGAVGGALMTGGASLTPAGLTARLGSSASRAVGGGVRGGAVAGAIEGSLGAAGAAVSHSALSNDPLTVESVIAEMGPGALLGAGLGAIGQSLIGTGSRARSRIAARAAARTEAEAVEAARDAARQVLDSPSNKALVSRFNEELGDVRKALSQQVREEAAAVRAAHRQVDEVNAAGKRGFDAAEAAHASAVKQAETAYRKAAEVVTPASIASEANVVRKYMKSSGVKWSAQDDEIVAIAKDMARKGKPQEALAKLDELEWLREVGLPLGATPLKQSYATALDEARAVSGAIPGRPAGYTTVTAMPYKADQATLDLIESLRAPGSLDKIAAAQPATLQRLDEAIKGAGSAGQQLKKTTEELYSALGYTDTGGGLVGLKEHLSGLSSKANAAKVRVPRKEPERAGLMEHFGRYGAMRAVGLGPFAAGVISTVIAASKTMARDLLRTVAAKAFEPAGKAITRGVPLVGRYYSAYAGGTNGDRRRDSRTLVKEHMMDVAHQNLTSADAAFEAVKPLIEAGHAAFAAQVQARLIHASAHLYAAMPKDPGTAMVGTKSSWLPSEQQAADFMERRLAVDFPLETIEDAVSSARPSQNQANTLWLVYPEMMMEAQAEVIEQMTTGKTIPYERRAAVAAFFKINYDGLQSKENVAAFQAIYGGLSEPKDSGQAPPTPKKPGRPAATEKTQVQRLQDQLA